MRQLVVYLTILLAGSLVYAQILEDCRTDTYPPNQNEDIEVEVLNLDLPPQQRWKHIVLKKKEGIKKFIGYLRNLIPSTIFDMLTQFVATGIKKFPAPYGDEIIGITKALDLPLSDLLACNVFYELEKVCTSIVTQDENGNIYHGRNLDLGALLGWDWKDNTWSIAEMLRPLTIAVDFQSGGKTVFKTVQFAGTVGVFTGVAPGKFSFSLNSRSASNFLGGPLSVVAWVATPSNHHRFASILAREVLEKSKSYEEASKKLTETPLLASVYYILAGTKPNQGVVISRSQTTSIKPLKLSAEKPVLVQTNYDHWKNPPFYDNRRAPASKCMTQLRQETFNEKDKFFKVLFNVLSTIPVLNKATIYTTLMSPMTGEMKSYRRDCTGACYPW